MSEAAPAPVDPNWVLVARLRPALRQHVRTYPQEYRGERWYVLLDESSGRNLRFNAIAYEFIGRLNGRQTVQQILDQLRRVDGEDALDEDEILLILTQLFALDVLSGGVPASAREFFERHQQDKRVARMRAAMNPLAIKVPLVDPDKFLNRVLPWARPVFGRVGALVWMVVVGLGVILSITSFPALRHAVSLDILAPANLALMIVMFVLIKAVHEFAHAITVKIWGGEVHEMGVTLLVMIPVPFVDASATWGFREKQKRMLVGAVGILAELFIAALALLLWLAVEPGVVKDAALNAFLIASVSTLLFNANPLLKFDGYHVLQDLIEIPNLSTRASRYWLYLIQRYLFGLKGARSPVTARGERPWFLFYGAAAVVYRLVIMLAIVLFLAEEYLFIGVALGCWAVFMQVVMPILRGVKFLYDSPALAGRRSRAGMITAGTVGGIFLLLVLAPVTHTTRAEGVVWVPDQAQLYTGADGFVREVLVKPGTVITAGTAVLQMQAPLLDSQIEVLEARYRALDVQRAAEYLQFRVQSEITAEEMQAVQAELDLLREQKAALRVASPLGGTFVLPEAQTLVGRYLKKGQLIGYVVSPDRFIVRSVVPQSDIGQVRKPGTKVEVRLAERIDDPLPAHILRETPSGSTALPSAALGAAGGGEIAVAGGDEGGRTAAEKVFHLDLGLPGTLLIAGVGERAYVRFDHGSEPLALQWWRAARQLLLSRLAF